MGVNVPQLVVHVEEAPEAVLSSGHGPVTRQDILVELQVRRSLCVVQQPWCSVDHHGDFPTSQTSPESSHWLKTQFPHVYILTEATHTGLSGTRSREFWSLSPIIGQV